MEAVYENRQLRAIEQIQNLKHEAIPVKKEVGEVVAAAKQNNSRGSKRKTILDTIDLTDDLDEPVGENGRELTAAIKNESGEIGNVDLVAANQNLNSLNGTTKVIIDMIDLTEDGDELISENGPELTAKIKIETGNIEMVAANQNGTEALNDTVAMMDDGGPDWNEGFDDNNDLECNQNGNDLECNQNNSNGSNCTTTMIIDTVDLTDDVEEIISENGPELTAVIKNETGDAGLVAANPDSNGSNGKTALNDTIALMDDDGTTALNDTIDRMDDDWIWKRVGRKLNREKLRTRYGNSLKMERICRATMMFENQKKAELRCRKCGKFVKRPAEALKHVYVHIPFKIQPLQGDKYHFELMNEIDECYNED